MCWLADPLSPLPLFSFSVLLCVQGADPAGSAPCEPPAGWLLTGLVNGKHGRSLGGWRKEEPGHPAPPRALATLSGGC